VSNPLRRYLEGRRARRRVQQSQDAEMLRISQGAVEILVEVRQMADYDPALPQALVEHMRQDLWNDPKWMFAAIEMLNEDQKYRVLGQRIRIASGWTTDEATIDSTEPHTVRAVHAARQVWIAAHQLHTVDGRHWWGDLTAGGFLEDGTYAPAQATYGPAPIDAEGLARSVPELLAGLGE
jgi:hypothetical protein